MRIEKLSKGRKEKVILVITILVLLIGIVYITNSRAKYQVTSNIQIVKGKVSYSLADLNVLALNVQSEKGSEKYNPTDEVPTGNYEVNMQNSYCTIPGDSIQHKDIPMEYKNGKIYIGINQKGTKCYIFLDKQKTTGEQLIANRTTEEGSKNGFTDMDQTEHADANGKSKLFSDSDDFGTTYYFRGKVKDNWVKFGKVGNDDIWWRIIRINGNGSIRMIYAGKGTSAPTSDGYLNNNGTGSQIQTKYNEYYNDNKYVGYMYGTDKTGSAGSETTKTTSYNQAHQNNFDSDIKKILDTWYSTNLKTNYGTYIDPNAGFCNDRQINTTPNQWWTSDTAMGYGKNATAYAPFSRLLDSNQNANERHTPTFKCTRTEDTFTLPGAQKPDGSDYGNHKLKANNGNGENSPIGLITIDETVFAGGYFGRSNNKSDNKQFYLYTAQSYWTMSPSGFYNGFAYVFYVFSYGNLAHNHVGNTDFGVRPVINLSANVKLSGDGTHINPYVVQ